jgi:hypothetical protein
MNEKCGLVKQFPLFCEETMNACQAAFPGRPPNTSR